MRATQTAITVAMLLATVRAGAETLPAHLRDTGLYADAELRVIAPGNLPFAPQYPLWTDGAAKRRWIHLPSPVDAARADAWEFPVGTRAWKEFSFGGRRVETRMIERAADGWRYGTYVFNASGRDAVLAPARGLTSTAEVSPGVRHAIPGELDCRSCHEGRQTPILGFSALQLSADRDPGTAGVDLAELVRRGLVRNVRDVRPRIPGSPTARAALGYLHGNCGHCHNLAGPLAPLGMSLDGAAPDAVAVLLASTVERPSQFRFPGDAAPVRISPGRPELGVLVQRMRSREPLSQMPPLGTRLVDTEGLALIERWIRTELTPTRKETRP
jgi:mono/diheme cytochrome c family protein